MSKIRITVEANYDQEVTLESLGIETEECTAEEVEQMIQDAVDQMAAGEIVISQWEWV